MALTPVTTETIIARNFAGLFAKVLGFQSMNNEVAKAGLDTDAYLNTLYVNTFATTPTADIAEMLVANTGITDPEIAADAKDYVVWVLDTNKGYHEGSIEHLGAAIDDILDELRLLEGGENEEYGIIATAWNNAVNEAVTYSAVPGNPDTAFDIGVATADLHTLTANTDVAEANIFDAGLVFTPAGNARVNSLQDEDILTGTGDNPTLNATLGNIDGLDAGAQANTVTPKLIDIETINVAFTGSGNAINELDLQDATAPTTVNITRVSDGVGTGILGPGAIIDNLKAVPANLSVTDSNNAQQDISFLFTNTAASGAEDATTLTLSNVNNNILFVQENGADGTINQGVETLNLVSSGSANTITTLAAEDLATLNISGDQNLSITGEANVNGSLSKVDASALTGNLTFGVTAGVMTATPDNATSGNMAFDLKSGVGTDTVTVNERIGTNDTFDLGEGSDTLRFQSAGFGAVDFIAANSAANNVSNVEVAQVRKTGAAVPAILSLRADEMTGDQAIELRDHTNNAASTTQYNIVNLTAAEATTISIAHSGVTTLANPLAASNSLANNLVELDVDAGVTAVNLTLKEGVNSDPRFSFQLYTDSDRALGATDATAHLYQTAQDAGTVNAVTDLTLTDSDNESNTIDLQADGYLNGAAQGDGTAYTKVTLTGGKAGQFLNLDTSTGNLGGMYGYDTTGVLGAADLQGIASVGAGATRLTAATIDASTFVGDAIVRVSSNFNDTNGAQAITMGTGNDTVIFDNQPAVGSGNAGLTISDTVKGGEGSDTLVFEGNVPVNIGSSEWTNVTGFETIRLNGNGAGNAYNLTLTNDLIDRNAADGNILKIINDNDTANDTVNTLSTAGTGVERGVTIDATLLASTNNFNYNGEEGSFAAAASYGLTGVAQPALTETSTADRFIFIDGNINGTSVIDGGAVDNDSDNRGLGGQGNAVVANTGNTDVIEVRNASQVDLGDLVGVSNIGNLSFTSVGSTTTQVSRLQLNDTIVDAMVDSYQSSVSRVALSGVTSVGNVEVLNVNAIDNMANLAFTVGLNIEAAALTDKSDLNVVLGRGINSVAVGAGNDTITVLGNYAAGTYGAAVGLTGTLTGTQTFNVNAQNTGAVIGARAVTDVIHLGAGANTIHAYGAVNLVGATIDTLVNGIATNGTINMIGHSAIVMTLTQFNALTNLTFVGNTRHQLTIVDDTAGAQTVDLSKITLSEGSLTYDITSSATGTGVAGGNTVLAGSVVNDISTTGGVTAGVVGTAPENDVRAPDAATYAITPSVAAPVNEGGTASFTVTTNAPDGPLTYNLSGTGITTTDVTPNALSGIATVTAGVATINILTVADLTTEGAETLVVTLAADGTNASVVINDTSVAGGATFTNSSLDGLGTPGAAVAPLVLANTGAINYTDNVATGNNVTISNFGADDKITVTGSTSAIYDSAISSVGTDVTITYNNNGQVNTIALVGVNAGGAFVNDVASFNALSVGDLFFA